MRRREPVHPAASKPPAPLWVTNLGAGLRHICGRPPDDPVVTDDLRRDLPRLRTERVRWHEENA